MPATDHNRCRPRALRLCALLAAGQLLGCSAWWPWGAKDAEVGGRYVEYDPNNIRLSEGLVVQNAKTVTATFSGKDWSPQSGSVSGSSVNLFGMTGSHADGVISWPNGFKWVRQGVPVPGGELVVEGPVPELGDETCSWKPVSDHGEGSTDCHGHNLHHHEKAKDSGECLESLAADGRCRFASFDAERGRCSCKHSCPTQVKSASTSSFQRVASGSGISGRYEERSPEGKPGQRGHLVQDGNQVIANFPGAPWSPASGSMAGDKLSFFGGGLTGTYANGVVTFGNGWKWLYMGKLTEAGAEAGQARDAAGVSNAGWVSSREQTPQIVQRPSELVDFPWKDLANVTCHLSEEDIRFYDQHGWVHVKQVLDPGALDLILDEAQSICKKQLATRGICQIEQLRWQVNRFRDFMLYSPMGCYAHLLIRGKGVRITTEALFGTQYNAKNPNFFSFHFHVDSMNSHRGVYHAFHSKTKGVSVWFPMHDVDPDETGGSIFVVDEFVGNNVSHHCRLKECGGPVEVSRSLMPSNVECTKECSKYRQPGYEEMRKTFKFDKGDVVFFHPEMPHATQPIRRRDFTRHSFTIRLVESDAEVCNVGGNCGDWMGCCADLPLENGHIYNHCFPQIYPQVLDGEVAAHYSSTAKHLMGDPAWNDLAHTIPRAPDCL